MLLDVGLPGEDGFAVARWLRERSGKVGIIMVTAAADTVDRVLGLETGADDYIPKPFEPRELLARIKSVLRRDRRSRRRPPGGPRVRMGRRVLDLERRVLTDGDGAEEALAASEFDLLRLFAENPNRPLARDWLLETAAIAAWNRSTGRSTSGSPGCGARSRRRRPPRGDPHRARRRLHVRAAGGIGRFTVRRRKRGD